MSKIIGVTVGTPLSVSKIEEKIKPAKKEYAAYLDKRITNIEKGLVPDSFETDSSVAYTKGVPADACPFAEVNTIGGMTYKDGNVLRSAPTTAVESVGANLIPFVSGSNSTVRGVTWTINAEGTVNANGTADGGNSAFYLADGLSLPTGNYVLSGAPVSAGWGVTVTLYYQNTSGDYEYINAYGGEAKAFTIQKETKCTIYLQVLSGSTISNVVFKPMLNKGSTAKPYTPYVKHTLSIPEAVQALDGYGEGVNESAYNYIDYEKKQFVKRVGCVDLGTLDWNGGETNVFYADIDNNLTPKLEGYVGVCSLYDIVLSTASANLLNKQMVIATLMQTGQAGRTFVKNTAYTDSATFKAAMSGVMLYYELATPEVTDISDILPADNYIGVEGGGTLTFKNQFEFDVPSEVTYITKGATV